MDWSTLAAVFITLWEPFDGKDLANLTDDNLRLLHQYQEDSG